MENETFIDDLSQIQCQIRNVKQQLSQLGYAFTIVGQHGTATKLWDLVSEVDEIEENLRITSTRIVREMLDDVHESIQANNEFIANVLESIK